MMGQITVYNRIVPMRCRDAIVLLMSALAFVIAPAGCGGGDQDRENTAQDNGADIRETEGGVMTMNIESTAFSDGGAIPKEYTGEGTDTSPPLSWSDAPEGTASFALICDDPDAPREEPWVHWVIYNIPADASGLPAGVERAPQPDQPAGARHAANSWPSDNLGYRGPMPPPGHGVHHYHFKFYALDQVLDLGAGATKKELLDAMGGHILAEGELIGTYER